MSSLEEAQRMLIREELAPIIGMLDQLCSIDRKQLNRRLFTVPELVKLYGIGRRQIIDHINSNRLPAIETLMRGGYRGWRVRSEDAERVLAGVQ